MNGEKLYYPSRIVAALIILSIFILFISTFAMILFAFQMEPAIVYVVCGIISIVLLIPSKKAHHAMMQVPLQYYCGLPISAFFLLSIVLVPFANWSMNILMACALTLLALGSAIAIYEVHYRKPSSQSNFVS